MKKIGLVLEGGGMRGVYTGGVLEFFLENNIYFPYVVGVSAGACNATSYLSRQKGRNQKVTIDMVDHPNYISYKNLLLKRQLFGMNFIFDEIPHKHVPFDYETFATIKESFLIGTTDCVTGMPYYIDKNDCKDKEISYALRASSSLPLMAPIVTFKNKQLLDGGISDPIPIKKSVVDGNQKHVVILTRNLGYRKKKQSLLYLIERKYKDYPKIVERMKKRHEIYNDSLAYIEAEEKKGNIFVFRPTEEMKVARIERNKTKLHNLFSLGYEDGKREYSRLLEWLDT